MCKVSKNIGGYIFDISLTDKLNDTIVGDVHVICEELEYSKTHVDVKRENFASTIIGIELELEKLVKCLEK